MTVYALGQHPPMMSLGNNAFSNVLDTLGVKMVFRSQLSSPYEIQASDVADQFASFGDDGAPLPPVVKEPSQPNFFLSKIFRPTVDLQAGGLRYTYAPWGEPRNDLRIPALFLVGGGALAISYLAYLLITGKCN